MSSILKTETMEIDMNLAVVNMFPQQFNIKRASNGTIWISYIISLFSVRIITPSRETDIWQIWILKGWTGRVPHVSPRGIANYKLPRVTFTNIRNRSQEFIMESDSRVALFVGAKQSSAKFC